MDLTITKCMDDADVPDVRLKITTYQKPHHSSVHVLYSISQLLKQAWSFQRLHQAAELQRCAGHTKSLFLQRLLDRGYSLAAPPEQVVC
jgi:hypothetical protein